MSDIYAELLEQTPILVEVTGFEGDDVKQISFDAPDEIDVTLAQGVPGEPGQGSTFDAIAGQILSGQRFVAPDINGKMVYTSGPHVTGMTLSAVLQDAQVPIALSGIIDEPSWTWTPGATLFLQANGFIGQTPQSGLTLEVGAAITATRIKIEIKIPIITGA